MVIEYYLLISNLFVTVAILLATLYRIKIERRLISIQYMNAISAQTIRQVEKFLRTEHDMIKSMNGDDFINFLEEVIKNAN